MFFAAFALSLVLAQDPAAQSAQLQAATTAEEQQRAEEEAHLDEVICRREHVVGSNRPQRICQTRRQWNNMRERSLDELNDRDGRGVEDHLPTAGAGR